MDNSRNVSVAASTSAFAAIGMCASAALSLPSSMASLKAMEESVKAYGPSVNADLRVSAFRLYSKVVEHAHAGDAGKITRYEDTGVYDNVRSILNLEFDPGTIVPWGLGKKGIRLATNADGALRRNGGVNISGEVA